MVRFVVAVWLTVCSLCASADGVNVTIAAFEISGVLQPDRQGAYDRLLARLADMNKQQWQFEYLPAKRVDMVLTKATGCAFPFDLRHFNEITDEQKGQLISAEPFNIAKVFLFTRPGTAAQTNYTSDPTFRLGARRGLPYGKEFDLLLATNPERIQLLHTDDAGVQMLLANRIDGLLAYFPDMSGYFHNHPNMPGLSYDPHKPIITHRDSIVCAATQKNKVFIEQLNASITKLKKSGELEEILDMYYVKP